MVWGCMGWNGVGQLAEVEGRMDADQYVIILEDYLLPSMEDFGISTQELIFQQDNDPKHTSKKAKKWMEDNDITLLDWPPQSPDLNPTVIHGSLDHSNFVDLQELVTANIKTF